MSFFRDILWTKIEKWIHFEDENAEAIFCAIGDTSGNGHISFKEAAAMNLSGQHLATKLKSFNEFPYFYNTNLYPSGLDGTGVIRGQGTSANSLILEEITFPDSFVVRNYSWREGFAYSPLKKITLFGSITSKGGAFAGSTETKAKLTEVNIPSVESWYKNNFENREDNPLYNAPNAYIYINGVKVTNLTVPEGVTKIGCAILCSPNLIDETFTIPSWITEIGDYAFYGNTNLLLDEIPDQITSIGKAAFSGCSNITLSEYPYAGDTVAAESFKNCEKIKFLELPSTITSIESYAFYNCKALALTSIPNGVTSIGDHAFMYCAAIQLTSLPTSLVTLGASAFQSSSVVFTELPSGVTSIPSDCFNSCTNLTSIKLNNATTVGAKAFFGCTALTSVELNSNTTALGASGNVFNPEPDRTGVFNSCTNLSTINIPDTVETIEAFCFYNCTSLETITHIPNNIKEIGYNAFAGVTTNISSFPSSLVRIGAGALENNTATSVTLNTTSQVVTLQQGYNTSPRPFGSACTTVYVPSSLVESYQNDSVWSKTGYTFAAIS